MPLLASRRARTGNIARRALPDLIVLLVMLIGGLD
jgi:hypothetical protein